MKKTWTQRLRTMAPHVVGGREALGIMLSTLTLGALMAGHVLGQSSEEGVVKLGGSPQQSAAAPAGPSDEEGSVQLGGGNAAAPASPMLQPVPGSSGPNYAGDPASVSTGEVMPARTSQPETIYPNGISGGQYPSDPFTSSGSTGDSVGYAATQDPDDVLFRVGRRNRDIYGVDEGFTSIGAYLSRPETSNRVWFVNPRLLITDQGRGGLNLGAGQKAYVPDLDRVFSLSGWWDFDSGHESDYHQVGVSFEMIGQNFSLRSNANFVVSRDEHQFGNMEIGNQRLLDDGSIVQDQLVFTEVAYNQADLEVAMPMPLAGQYGWEWAGGIYFLTGGDGRDATGVKGRVESQVTEDLWVNMLITNDRVFDTNVSVNLEFTIPTAPPSKWWRRPNVRDHLWTSVRRYYRVPTNVVENREVVPVMGQDGQAMRLALIDPNITDDPLQAFGGSGTLADPFKSIADYMDESLATQDQFGIIAVRSRTDDTDLNLNTTIVLRDNQAFLGEGVVHSLDGLGLEPIALPIADAGIPRPRLTNSEAPGVDVVTLANNNQVSGFVIDAGGTIDDLGDTASGIVGENISGFNINRVDMTNVIDGIRITHTGAPGGSVGIIRDNMITGIGLGSTRGVSIEHESGTLGLLVSDNTIADFQGEDANRNGVLDLSEDVNMNGILDPGEDLDFDGVLDLSEDLNMNGMLDRGFGVYVSASGGSTIFADDPDNEMLPLGIVDNTLTANGTGLSMTASGASLISANVERNIATGSTDFGEDANGNGLLDMGEDINMNGALDFGSGLNFFADGATISLVTFIENSGIDGAGNGATFQTLNGGAINVVNPNVDPDTLLPATAFTNNTFTGNDLDGMFVRADSGSIIFDQIQDSVFNSNGDDGLDLETDNAGTIFVRDPVLGNSFVNNGDNGIEVTGGVGGGVTVTIGDPIASNPNVITGNGFGTVTGTGAGIFLGTDGGIINASLQGTTSNNNAGSGAVIFADGGTILLDGIAANIFRLNGRHGLEIIANNGGSVITPFVGSADQLLSGSAGIPGTTTFSNDFALNEEAGLFLGGSNDTLGGPTGLIDLGSVTLNRFQRQGEDIDNDGNIDVDEDVNGNNVLDMGEDLDGDGRLDVAENVNGVIADGILNPSQGEEGILIDASDLVIMGTLTRNAFIGRRPVTINTPPFNVIPAVANGEARGGGSSFGIGGEISGTSATPGGLFLQIGTSVEEDENIFLDNGEAHIGLTFSGNTVSTVVVENGVFNDAFDVRMVDTNLADDNDITLNQAPMGQFTGEGIHYVLEDTAQLTGGVFDSIFDRNEGDGLEIEILGNNDVGNTPLQTTAMLNDFMIVRNEFTRNGIRTVNGAQDGQVTDVLSNGLRVSRTERGQFNDLMVVDNLFAENTQNGIQISSVGANQLNLPNMRADTVLIASNEIRDNLQDGIEFIVGADADLAARVASNLITNNGFGEVPGNLNVGNGIEVRERIQDAKDSRSFTGLWTNNVITDNFDDGIDLSAKMGNPLTDLTEAGVYTVAPPAPGTTFPVLGELRTWGLVIGDITLNPIGTIDMENSNLVQGNGGDGIDITGGGAVTIANNFITDNGTPEMIDGDDFTGLIARHAGIHIAPPELNAGVSGNFTSRDPRPLPNDDVDPDLDAFRDALIFSNLISQNNGDGIEFLSQSSIDASDAATSAGLGGNIIETRLMIAQNEITLNQFRGIDILQRPGSSNPANRAQANPEDRSFEDPDGVPGALDSGFVSADVSIIGNHVKGNQWEGIYVVQTVDDFQNQISPSHNTIDGAGNTISNNESLRAQGAQNDIDDIARLRLDVHDNQIIGNGDGIIDFPASGLVVRYGTTGGTADILGYPAPTGDPNIGVFNAANYFATSGFNMEDLDGNGLLDNDQDGDGFLDAAAVTGSGVSASVTGNVFDGNFGDDILFQSFTATIAPTTTGGDWNEMEFDVMVFQADPLARIDLIFSLNRFNSVEPNNVEETIGTSPGNAGVVEAGAYYDNAEATFKSRSNMADPPGPFNPAGTRDRNATRFASRWVTGDQLPPLVSPENGLFKYPGMGNSTQRVRGEGNFYTDQGLGAVTLPQIFIFDEPGLFGNPELIDAFFEANGVDMTADGAILFGELPWGWDVLEPGTPALPPSF